MSVWHPLRLQVQLRQWLLLFRLQLRPPQFGPHKRQTLLLSPPMPLCNPWLLLAQLASWQFRLRRPSPPKSWHRLQRDPLRQWQLLMGTWHLPSPQHLPPQCQRRQPCHSGRRSPEACSRQAVQACQRPQTWSPPPAQLRGPPRRPSTLPWLQRATPVPFMVPHPRRCRPCPPPVQLLQLHCPAAFPQQCQAQPRQLHHILPLVRRPSQALRRLARWTRNAPALWSSCPPTLEEAAPLLARSLAAPRSPCQWIPRYCFRTSAWTSLLTTRPGRSSAVGWLSARRCSTSKMANGKQRWRASGRPW
mmetsp:Transcript_46406/g.129111  ORF Transcript_46406/g.129111 Transcript_46406/m.129111 type:complete len:304 (+) Transcript_46406:369-1280(+)